MLMNVHQFHRWLQHAVDADTKLCKTQKHETMQDGTGRTLFTVSTRDAQEMGDCRTIKRWAGLDKDKDMVGGWKMCRITPAAPKGPASNATALLVLPRHASIPCRS
jgi:hypothetical protein